MTSRLLRLTSLCAAAATLAVCFGCADSSDPLAPLRAASGCAGWAQLGSLRVSGRYDADGLPGTFSEVLEPRTGRFALRTDRDGLVGGAGYDGTDAWSRDLSGAAHALDAADAVKIARTDAWLARRGWCDEKNEGARVRSLGRRSESGRTFSLVRVVPKDGAPVEMWIDVTTRLLDRTIEQLNENRRIVRFSRWRSVAGTQFPYELRNEDPEDESSERYEVVRVEPAPRPPATEFVMPPLPNDVVMLHGAEVTHVPYRFEGQKPIIDVWLNGVGPLPFVLDTGGHFIVTPDTARRIGVKPRGSASNTGQGTAIRRAGFARVGSVRIGDAEIHGDVAHVIPYSYARIERGPRPPKAGWLGLSLFERFAVRFDPVSRTVTLRPLERPRPQANGARIPMTFSEDAPLIDCRIEGHAGPCMIDTGNAGYTIVEGHWAETTHLGSRLQHGIDAGDDVTIGRADVAFGPFSFPREIVEYSPPAERGSESTTVEAAILAAGLLDRFAMTVDYGVHALWMEPLANGPVRPFNRSGIQARKEANGTFEVVRVIAESPAARAGLHSGDRLLEVDGVPAKDLAAADLSDSNVGPVGARRTYVIERAGVKHTITLELRELLP